MRTLVTLIVLTAAAAPAAAQGQAILPPDVRAVLAHVQRERPGGRQLEGVEQTERITRTFRLNGGELHLANLAGDISITRGGGNDVSVEIVKIARGRDEADAREMLTMVELDIAERNNRAEVRTRYPQNTNRRNFNVSVNYTVTAPASVRVRATPVTSPGLVGSNKTAHQVVAGDPRILGEVFSQSERHLTIVGISQAITQQRILKRCRLTTELLIHRFWSHPFEPGSKSVCQHQAE